MNVETAVNVSLAAQRPDYGALLPILRELEFHTLVRSLTERFGTPAPEPVPAVRVATVDAATTVSGAVVPAATEQPAPPVAPAQRSPHHA